MYKVLLVEDEKLIRKGLAFSVDWFSFGCYAPVEAPNGQAGLEMIAQHRPDIVITDVKMPLMDGISMLQQGLAQHSFESIIISGFNEFNYAKTAIKLGVTNYLLKPVQMEELAEAIQRCCEKAQAKSLLQTIQGGLSALAPVVTNVLEAGALERSLNTASRHVSYLLKSVRDRFDQRISLKRLSEELQISTTYLNQKFKEETCYTFNDFLNRYRIQKAIEMLMNGQLKIYEISEKAGFTEYRYFTIVFKKYVGCAPSEFCSTQMENVKI